MADAHALERRRLALAQIAEALHDLCQPLTALQCRLEIGQMNLEMMVEADRDNTPAVSGAVLAECLRECGRLNASVNTMRSLVRQARADERENELKNEG